MFNYVNEINNLKDKIANLVSEIAKLKVSAIQPIGEAYIWVSGYGKNWVDIYKENIQENRETELKYLLDNEYGSIWIPKSNIVWYHEVDRIERDKKNIELKAKQPKNIS